MRNRLLPLIPFILAASAQAAEPRWISAEEWSRPRGGETLTALPPLRQSVQEWMATPEARLVIRHPGGEEGGLWAGELRAWLVALGVPGERIELAPGAGREDAMALEVLP